MDKISPSICISLYSGLHPGGGLAPLETSFEGVLPVHAEIEVPAFRESDPQGVSLFLCLLHPIVPDIVSSFGKQIKDPGIHPSGTPAEFFLLK